jgi:hypothetical protein
VVRVPGGDLHITQSTPASNMVVTNGTEHVRVYPGQPHAVGETSQAWSPSSRRKPPTPS